MIEYFVLRGHDHNRLVNLTELEKSYYYAVMIREHEREETKYKALTGKGK